MPSFGRVNRYFCQKKMTYSQDKNIAPTIIEIIEGVSFEMILVKGGSFLMGLQTEDQNAKNYVPVTFYDFALNRSSIFFDSTYPPCPAHQVYVPDFYIGKYPLTQRQWKAIVGTDASDEKFKPLLHMMNNLSMEPDDPIDWGRFTTNNPSCFCVDDDSPVENINLFDIQHFLQKLRDKTHKSYRLPTEAEWEYAAGEGQFRNPYILRNHALPDNDNWENALTTFSVFDAKANKLGIYHMMDNIYEWCQDTAALYPTNPQNHTTYLSLNKPYIIRGSAYEDLSSKDLQFFIFARFAYHPYVSDLFTGFRLALST